LNDAFARKVKRKSIARLKAELWNKLLPKVDPAFLASEINEFLHRHMGKSGRHANLANNLAAYLTQKYLVANRKTGQLRSLIELHPQDFTAFLDEIRFKGYQALAKIADQLPQQKRVKPHTENEKAERRKKSKSSYDRRRRQYREGLIIKQFGTFPRFSPLGGGLATRPEGPCLDILFRGEGVRMAACAGSLEDLFGAARHSFPKSLLGKRTGRNVFYYLDAFMECLIHFLVNRDGGEQWLPQGPQRDLVLNGIIARADRDFPKVGGMLAQKLRPYLS
jgi:hypothetical protein